ncbi:hypothetical protein [Trinickia fusca]|nr:hypothetical protein [Trinickia fusca]
MKTNLKSLSLAMGTTIAMLMASSAMAQVYPMGNNSYNSQGMTPGGMPVNTVINIVPASSNTHGIIVQNCSETVWGSTWGANTLVIASPTQPTPLATGNIVLFSVLVPPITVATLPHPVYVPAGNGLWAYTSGTGGSIYCNYDFSN